MFEVLLVHYLLGFSLTESLVAVMLAEPRIDIRASRSLF